MKTIPLNWVAELDRALEMGLPKPEWVTDDLWEQCKAWHSDCHDAVMERLRRKLLLRFGV